MQMDTVNILFAGNEEDLKNLTLSPQKKRVLKEFFTKNTETIYKKLLSSKNVESQIALLGIILRTLNREEIVKEGFLGEHSKGLSMVQRNNKNSVLHFLKEFNQKESGCEVIGMEIDSVIVSKGDNTVNTVGVSIVNEIFKAGYMFMGNESFRIQKDSEVVIIQFRSVICAKVEGIELKIEATEGRRVIIKMKYNQDIRRLKGKVERIFDCDNPCDCNDDCDNDSPDKGTVNDNKNIKQCMETEDSLVVDIGKRVSFSPEVHKQYIKPVTNQLSKKIPVTTHKDRNVITVPKHKDRNVSNKIINPPKHLRNKIDSSKHRRNKIVSNHKEKSVSKNRKLNRLKSFKKENVFNQNLQKKIKDIYALKIKIAKTIYKALKEDACEFKKKIGNIALCKIDKLVLK